MKKSKPTTIEKWLGTDDQMCVDIVNRKYLLDEDILGHKETVDEMLDRVSGGNEDAKKLMRQRKFLPGGRILANRGLYKYGIKITYSNCYVDPAPEDSIESIYETCKRLARTFSYGGGIGIDISKLAPAGAKVRNSAGKSTGAVSFIDTFSGVAETIGMHNRRGALMISIDGKHPDLEKFITHKSDLGITQGANMSVRFTDDFFEAVQKDDSWTLSFTRKETGETTEEIVNARDILKLIAKTNWDYAEPGILFWDRITKYNLMSEDESFSYAGTNPCVTGDTLILTEFGYYPIEALVGQTVNIWNGYEWSEVVPRVTGTNQPILKIDFSDGSSIKCTNYHKFIMSSGEDVRVEAKDLKVGDCICKSEFPIIEGTVTVDDKIMYTKGFLAGDGTIDSRGRNFIYLYGEKMNLLSYLDYEKFWNQTESSNRYCLQLDNSKYILMADKYYVPTSYNSISSRLAWLAGYMDADGTVNSSQGSVSITSINRNLLEEVKLMLNTLGCTGVIGVCKTDRVASLPDGNGGYKDYNCATSYRLTISAFYINKLMQLGLRTNRLQLFSTAVRESSRYPQIVNITNLGIAPVVYCVTDELRHSVVFGGIRTANCGEEPLPAGGSCLLGAMNLSEYYNKGLKSFEYNKFGKDVRIAVRYLNEVLDEGQELHPLKEQRETVRKLKQIGLGFMGLADLFIKMGIEYGSQESLDVCHHIGYIMIYSAIQESIELASEKGPFENCDAEKIMNSDFWKHNIDDNPWVTEVEREILVHNLEKYGMRNSQLLTCAPTGTISTILNISGGIEPMFALHYTRTTKSLYGKDKTYTVYPNAVKDYMKSIGVNELDSTHELPFFMVTSRDIPWVRRINVQAAWQEHIDASISATINLPEDTTVDEIADLYTIAHENGLKGVTVFRENCKRTAILNDTSSKKKEEPKENPDCEGCKLKLVVKEIEKAGERALSNIDAPKEILIGYDPSNESERDRWSKEHNCHGNPQECTLENKCPDCGANGALLGAAPSSLEWDGNDIKGPVGESGLPGPEEIIKTVKKLFLSSFSPILTRSDFGENLHGTTYYEKVACGHIYITVNRYAGRPVEVFMQSSKSGGCAANTEALGRLASTMLRAGIDPNVVIDSTLGVKCAACSTVKGKGEQISGLSCSDVMARVIKKEWNKYLNGDYDNEVEEYINTLPTDKLNYLHNKYVSESLTDEQRRYMTSHVHSGTTGLSSATAIDIEKICNDIVEKENCKSSDVSVLGWNYKEHSIQENIDHSVCPECGARLRFSEGCMKCDNCGFSKC